jgi:hypothetical protein
MVQGPWPTVGNGVHIVEEVHDVLRVCQQRQVAADHDPVETVVYECQQVAETAARILPIGPLASAP